MAESFDQFAVVEIMGHQKYAGRVTEQVIGGAAFVRVDIPEVSGQPAFTKIVGAGSIFCITPVTEEIAKGVAANCRNVPISVYDLPDELRAKLRQPALTHVGPDGPSDDELDDDDFDSGE